MRVTGPASPHSHPDAPVRHSYPLAVEEAGFGTALSLMSRTLPYAVVRFCVLLVFSVVTILWLVVAFGGASFVGATVHPWIGMGWLVASLGRPSRAS